MDFPRSSTDLQGCKSTANFGLIPGFSYKTLGRKMISVELATRIIFLLYNRLCVF